MPEAPRGGEDRPRREAGKHEEGTGWGWSLRCAGLAGGAGDPDGVGDIEALAGHESSVGVWPGRAWQDEKLAMAQQGRYAETASPLFLSENLGLHRGGSSMSLWGWWSLHSWL